MQALLTQQGLAKALRGRKKLLVNMPEEKKDDIMEKAFSAILSSLSDVVLYEVFDEKTVESLWLKLESLYMTKSLSNRLYLKQRLHGIRFSEEIVEIQEPSIYREVVNGTESSQRAIAMSEEIESLHKNQT
ncbi:hypothetical protein LWI29_032661 [Acer saccharum]|uniref:Uncharacterized protein n=1 Tax=Acer saccharum TaxID=4024 RepID=A0AA39VM44_ACESA|nr:hypothetical protein LWI29_032661 [Acer saccharum]